MKPIINSLFISGAKVLSFHIYDNTYLLVFCIAHVLLDVQKLAFLGVLILICRYVGYSIVVRNAIYGLQNKGFVDVYMLIYRYHYTLFYNSFLLF